MKPPEFIRMMRERKCLTQKELSQGICAESTIVRLEGGKHTPGLNILRNILNKLGVSIDDFQAATQENGSGEPPPIQPSAAASEKIRPFVERLNEHFNGHARVLGLPIEPPTIDNRGEYIPTDEELVLADEIRPTLKVNDPHALLDGEPDWKHTPLTIPSLTTDFAVIQAKRRLKNLPRVISASAVIVSSKQRLLFVHKRSLGSATYPGLFHTFGGAFQPEKYGKGEDNLKETMLREVKEESKKWLSKLTWPVMISEEITTGFIQCVFLGVVNDEIKRTDNWEGSSYHLSFDTLPDTLLQAKPWVGSGKLHILAWLAAGSPGCQSASFLGQDATSLLEDVISKSSRDYPPPNTQT